MGIATSKSKVTQQSIQLKSRTVGKPEFEEVEDIRVETINKRDEQEIRTIKKDLNETPDMFVLNNILMSMMFFENFQKDIKEVIDKRYEKGEAVIKPDTLFEKLNKNIRYRPIHGDRKHISEPLVANRLYATSDTVQVLNSPDNCDTSNKNSVCHVKMESCSRNGFAKLQKLNSNPHPTSKLTIPITEPTPSTSRSSTDTESDTSYGYTTITEHRTPKPLEIANVLQNTDSFPLKPCFVYRKIRKPFCEIEIDQDASELSEDDFFDTVSYMTSRGFMKYFTNYLFPINIGESLGFNQFQIRSAKWIPGKIFCNLVDENDNHLPCEVIPSLSISWPEDQTFQFLRNNDRPRNSWPTQRMLSEIKRLECSLVPKGYLRKRGEYPEGDLQWEVHFPKAERYLASWMSHSQIRCFLFLLILHKEYIESVTLQQGLLAEHIRTHMYWECQKNFTDWPEHRLGHKMKEVIGNLIASIRKRELNDFFVQNKNVFTNIPRNRLEYANKVFHDVLQSPVMSFIKALRNIRYTSGKFYPPLDFNELQQILVKDGLEYTNPQILSPLSIPPNYRNKKFKDKEMQWKHMKVIQRKEKVIQERQNKMEKKENREESKEEKNLSDVDERRKSVDSVDLEWNCPKKFDLHKKRALLKLFINTYIGIAKKSSQIGTSKQTLFYLKQAWYLTKILEDESAALGEEVEELLDKIRKEEEACKKRMVKEEGSTENNFVSNGVHYPYVSNEVLEPSNGGIVFLDTMSNDEPVQEKKTFVKNKLPRKSVAFVDVH